MTVAELEQLARRINVDLFAGGKLEIADELYPPALAEQVKKLVTAVRAGFPDLTIDIEHLIAAGDKVACRWSATGTQEGWFHGVPPTRARVTWTGTSIYVVADGRVADTTSNWDLFGLLQQLRTAMQR